MKKSELKPCKYCKKTPVHFANLPLKEHWYDCVNKYCPSNGNTRETDAKAIKAWNTRQGDK